MHRQSHSSTGRTAAMLGMALCAGVLSGADPTHAASPDTGAWYGAGPVAGALGETKFIIDTRLRGEFVDQDPLAETADALTLRARLGFETGRAWETALLVEGEFVRALVDDFRGDPALPAQAAFPVVPDPDAQEINRLQLTNTRIPGTTITLGRQRINLDDQRFVGNVGWRQNEQTFDALRVVNRSHAPLTVDVTWLNQVNRVFGPDSPQGRYRGDGWLANLAWQTPVGRLTGFGYLLDFEPVTTVAAALDPARASTATYGLRLAGERPLSRIRLGYALSWATQDDYGSHPLSFSNDYTLAEVTAFWRQFSLGVGHESLGSDGTAGFATPLATLHRFQGWADKFLSTPANGLDDRYVTAGISMKGVGFLETLAANIVYHDYVSARSGIDYGDEVDLQLQARRGRVTGTLKYAGYTAAATTPTALQDTGKLWVQVDFVW